MRPRSGRYADISTLPWLIELESWAEEFLEWTDFADDEEPVPSDVMRVLGIPVGDDVPRGSIAWYSKDEGMIHIRKDAHGPKLEDEVAHELGHWFFDQKNKRRPYPDRERPAAEQDLIVDDLALFWRCPPKALKAKLQDSHSSLAHALPGIVERWGHIDAAEGFPRGLVMRVAQSTKAGVILWVGRERLLLGGGVYEMNVRIDPARERRAAEYVQETGKLASIDAVHVWPLRYGDHTAAAIVVEGSPSLGTWRGLGKGGAGWRGGEVETGRRTLSALPLRSGTPRLAGTTIKDVSELRLCDVCGKPATGFDHSRSICVCPEHDDGFSEPLQQAALIPWSERELARFRRVVAKNHGSLGLHDVELSRWLATLDAALSRASLIRL